MNPFRSQKTKFVAMALSTIAVLGALVGFHRMEEAKMHAMPAGLVRFDLAAPPPECGRWKSHMPTVRDPEIYRVYIAARRLWRSKIEWQLTKLEALRILHDVSFAADHGDWGALALMSYFYREGLGPLPGNNVLEPDANKTVAISRKAVAAGQAWGYFDLGIAHQYGYGGAVQDDGIAWAYFLKAAQLGSPEGQMALAEAYEDVSRHEDAAVMWRCALNQGHGPAARLLGMQDELAGRIGAAIKIYQQGVAYGSDECARTLNLLFMRGHRTKPTEKELVALRAANVTMDPDREQRYSEILDALSINPDLRFSRIDEFLPLPPSELPEWRGPQEHADPEPPGPPTY